MVGSATTIIVSCVTVKPIIGPDGTTNQLISCMAIETCYEDAQEICKGPYKIINTSTETSGDKGSTRSVTKLLVKCAK